MAAINVEEEFDFSVEKYTDTDASFLKIGIKTCIELSTVNKRKLTTFVFSISF